MNDSLITQELLDEIGITAPNGEESNFLTHLNTTLEERIGTEITESLDDQQLADLIEVQEQDDIKKTANWLAENVPELDEIRQDQTDILLGELVENTDGINAGS